MSPREDGSPAPRDRSDYDRRTMPPRIPPALRDKLPEPRNMQRPCGFCATGQHQYCPRAIRNGNGSVVACPCPAHETKAITELKCLECWITDAEQIDPKLWLCWDGPACLARVEVRLGQSGQMVPIHNAFRRAAEQKAEQRAQAAKNPDARAAKNPSRPTAGTCVHCGEKTGGGLFRPGHDAKLLSEMQAEARAGGDKGAIIARLVGLGVKPALVAKLEGRLANV